MVHVLYFSVIFSFAHASLAQDISASGRNLRMVSSDQCRQLVKQFDSIYLDQCAEISKESLEILVAARDVLALNGLENITIEQAVILTRARCFICLDGLKKIDSKLLEILSGCKLGVSLGGLKSLDVDQAREIGKFSNIYLNGLLSLSSDVAEELSHGSLGMVKLNKLALIEDKCLSVLASSKIELWLGGIRSLTVNQANIIARGTAFFRLERFSALPDDIFFVLNKCKSNIHFPGIMFLTQKQSFEYRYGSGLLRFNGLVEIEPAFIDSLHCLGKVDLEFPCLKKLPLNFGPKICTFRWRRISLPSISKINQREAYWLGMCAGELDLSGLNSIDYLTACHLSRFLGILDLSGLTEISVDTAAALGQHVGMLDLSGVRFINDAKAKALEGHIGTIILNSVEYLSPSSFDLLCRPKVVNMMSVIMAWRFEGFAKMLLYYKYIFDQDADGGFVGSVFNSYLRITGLNNVEFALALRCFLRGGDRVWVQMRNIHPAALALLCLSNAHIDFDRLDNITIMHFMTMFLHNGTLNLRKKSSLNNLEICLIAMNGGDILLGEIECLGETGAQCLARHKGFLSLTELKKISYNEAVYLAGHNGIIGISSDLILSCQSEMVVDILRRQPFHVMR